VTRTSNRFLDVFGRRRATRNNSPPLPRTFTPYPHVKNAHYFHTTTSAISSSGAQQNFLPVHVPLPITKTVTKSVTRTVAGGQRRLFCSRLSLLGKGSRGGGGGGIGRRGCRKCVRWRRTLCVCVRVSCIYMIVRRSLSRHVLSQSHCNNLSLYAVSLLVNYQVNCIY
jgi:hypothetical protein